jgi:RHS repeat-associated protein
LLPTSPRNAQNDTTGQQDKSFSVSSPAINLPKGGGAIRGIGEKFAANPVTGTGSMTVPIATSPGRSGFGPQLNLSYDSGSGNGLFGLGWNLSLPSITRKTDKGLPQYLDGGKDQADSDVYILSGAEDLVAVLEQDAHSNWTLNDVTSPDGNYLVRRYCPRIEGLFARIERWTDKATGETHWRSISKDNITTLYGKDNNSRIFDPHDPDPIHPTRIFSWLICQSYDDKGSAIIYEYKKENSQRIFEDQQGKPIALVHERNRSDTSRSANRYLKRIKYGNRKPNRDAKTWKATDPTQLTDWMFEVVFDYGEGHYQVVSQPGADPIQVTAKLNPAGKWGVRKDPISSYRASFEVRTYRLCRRVLMFHHFPLELGVDNCLVRSTEFTYDESPIASFITSVTQSGYVRQPTQGQPNRYLKKSLPPLEFEYSKIKISDMVQELELDSAENLPIGLDGANYQWVDLDGESISGILTEQADGWYYKRNISPLPKLDNDKSTSQARFAPMELVATKPSTATLSSGRQQFLDLAGDGQLDLVQFSLPLPGYYERTDDGNWESLNPFHSLPNVDWRDPNLKFVDLTGDGHADILITEENVFSWYPSLAEEGFGSAERAFQGFDEEKGPRLVFSDGTQSIYLGDFSGDSLIDIARIRNGEICYWPNLGYGRFGAKVTMDNSPLFDSPDQFDQRRIRLGDSDGSGTIDIFYLGRESLQVFLNESGNAWADPQIIRFPKVDNVAAVQAVDLLGNGTACLVWSSPLPSNSRRAMRYIDLMGGEKPHLLLKVTNNLGAETVVHYATSTRFYLENKYERRPWITKLPFPVHVVDRVETYDRISRSRFVTRYAYHHGYFNGEDREFRGFGMVEQWDTEEIGTIAAGVISAGDTNLDNASFVPPVHTKTWFHTGALLEGEMISLHFAHEYYGSPAPDDPNYATKFPTFVKTLLPDTILPPGLVAEEEREACRALKGSMLRQEVYAEDGTSKAQYPYTVIEQNFTIQLSQPQSRNRHPVLFTHARESINYHYERNPADPRVGHTLNLEVDKYGNVLKSLSVSYGRRQGQSLLQGDDKEKQERLLITYTENAVTNLIDDFNLYPDDYRTPLPSETRTYEVTGFALTIGVARFSFEDFAKNNFQSLLTLKDINYEEPTDYAKKQKRLIEHVRTLYRNKDLTGYLGLGKVDPMALPGESYKLAFTPNLLKTIFIDTGKLSPNHVNSVFGTDGGYVHSEGDTNWWIPSGQIFYSPNPAQPLQELIFARQHFFLPHRYRDPFHTIAISTESSVTYDAYDLLILETRDALGNQVTVGERLSNGAIAPTKPGNDYRVLQPWRAMDPNRNRTQVAFDALGLVVGTAVMGKPEDNPVPGDRLEATFRTDLTQAETDQFLANPMGAIARTLLDKATTRIVYDLELFRRTRAANPGDSAKWLPPFAATLARETHVSDLQGGQQTKIQISFSYSDGFGREIQKKIQAETGPVPRRNAAGQFIVGADGQPVMTPNDVSPRWVGSGWTVFNNKGKPVRQYEPFFTDTHKFEFDIRIGVSPVLFYDPVQRVVATLHPNHTWEKVVFDAWRQATWDVNDTVLVADPKTDPDVGDFFSRLPNVDYLPTWRAQRQGGTRGPQEQAAARKAAIHAATPSVAHADSLGRTFLTIAHNKFKYSDTPPAALPVEEFYPTRVILDLEDNQREVRDERKNNLGNLEERVVMRYDYDMLGNRIHQVSMEAGERWLLSDVGSKPIRAWDSRGHVFRTKYDPLRRPLRLFATGANPANPNQELLTELLVYGEQHPQHEMRNLRGKLHLHLDQVGVVTNESHDFKGNLLQASRRLAREYKAAINWSSVNAVLPANAATKLNSAALEATLAPRLEADIFTSRTRYDALNRPIQLIAPHGNQTNTKVNVIQPSYNAANLLEKVDAWLNQNTEPAGLLNTAATLHAVTDVDYDAKGQRTLTDYGNGVSTTYTYDPLTFRLIHLLTRRDPITFPGDCPQPPPSGWPGCQVQNLYYVYDPVGNITHIRDDAQQTIYFLNNRIDPSAEYTYDAIYRLIEATGREHIGQVGQPETTWNDEFRVKRQHPHNGQAMRNYTEAYEYDAVGNFEKLIHQAANGDWTRSYAYDEDSLTEPTKKSNRLSTTTIGNGIPEPYTYDAHGNMTRMNHLPLMQWDYRDQLQDTAQQLINNGVPETTWYVYDSGGQRVRKVTESAVTAQDTANGVKPKRKKERIYLGGFEIYREYNSAGSAAPELEREALHVMDDKQRIVLMEKKTRENGAVIAAPVSLIRYQLGNHLGSASLELDKAGAVISYEEYFPYGSTSYQAGRNAAEVSLKRYRYTGKERDEESGLYYHGARYYAPWLGRWTGVDPVHLSPARLPTTNPYWYANSRPSMFIDPDGRDVRVLEKSTTSAKEFVDAIKASEHIPEYMKKAFSVSKDGHSIKVSKRLENIPRGEKVPEWWQSLVQATSRGEWELTTGTLHVPEGGRSSAALDIDIEHGHLPGYKAQGDWVPNAMALISVDPTTRGLTVANVEWELGAGLDAKRKLRYNVGTGEQSQGLVVLVTQIAEYKVSPDGGTTEKKKPVPQDELALAFLHEFAVHAGRQSGPISTELKDDKLRARHLKETARMPSAHGDKTVDQWSDELLIQFGRAPQYVIPAEK